MKNRPTRFIIYVFLGITGLFLSQACIDKKDFTFDDITTSTTLHPSFGVNIGTATVKISDIIKEKPDTLIFNQDGTINIRFKKDSLLSYKVSELFTMPEFPKVTIGKSMGIQTVGKIGAVKKYVTLGSLSDQLDPTIKTAIIAAETLTNAGLKGTFPKVDPQPAGEFAPDNVIDNFEYATFESGSLSITIENKLPITLKTIILQLWNAVEVNGKLEKEAGGMIGELAYSNITNVAPNNKSTLSFDLKDKTIKNKLIAVFKTLETEGGEVDKVDRATQGIGFEINSSDQLQVKDGKAKIPSDTAPIEGDQNLDVSPGADVEITKIKIKKGSLDFNINTNFKDEYTLTLNFPQFSGIDNKKVIKFGGSNQPGVVSIPLSGAILDLTGNKLIVTYDIPLFNSAIPFITFNFADKIDIDVTINNFEWEYVTGFFGLHETKIDPQKFAVDMASIEGLDGKIALTDPRIKLEIINNSIGLPVNMKFDISNSEGAAVNVNEKLNNPIQFDAEYKKTTLLNINKTTYPDMISLLSFPFKELNYSGLINIGDNAVRENYVTDTSTVLVNLAIDVPFEFKAENVKYEKKFAGPVKLPQDAKLKIVKLFIDVENQFPFDLSVDFEMRDSTLNKELDKVSKKFLEAATFDTNGNIVTKKYTVEISLTEEEVTNLQIANQFIAVASFSTLGTEGVSIRHDATLKMGFRIAAGADVNISLDSNKNN
ncbi:MAG TPA: hypothetical protein DCQ31_04395 [Bacteroidales bacterium]|nr:hypothetical protein [Bacteroidales bacterium]